jgi:hypothetical protein
LKRKLRFDLENIFRIVKRFRNWRAPLDESQLENIVWIVKLFNQIENVPGHLAEIGVASGGNTILFGKLIKQYGQSTVRRYFGFDTFEGFNERDLSENEHLSGNLWKSRQHSLKSVEKRIKINGLESICKLIKGDAAKTCDNFLRNYESDRFKPGMSKFALLYIDCNAYIPAITAMENFYEYLSPGGVICIDEKVQGAETSALIRFAEKRGLKVLRNSNLDVPMQIVKP